ncbi:MAG: histidine kinase dimerization/phosphoacceptor domain -containing protein [Gammaproteobacteria bacterium]|jgi:two-component sensor histidine kinase
MDEVAGEEEQGKRGNPAADGAPAKGDDTSSGLRYLANFAGLITTLTGRFVILGPETLDEEITNALREIGEFAAVDRSYVFQFSADGSRISNTHEWCARGIEPAIDLIQDAPVEDYEWAMSRFKRGEVLYIERVADLPPSAASVKAELDRQGIQSLINLPLICAGRVLGFVGFDSVRRPQTWTDDHIKLLKVVGEIIAGAIELNRATVALKRQVEMETLVAQISTRFINVHVSHLNREVDRAIGEIGRFTGVDRSYVFRFEDDGRTMSNTDEWCAPGIEPHINRLQGFPVEAFGYSMSRMRRGEVFHVPDVSRLPAEAAAEKAEFEAEGIRTLINVPIMRRGEMTGFLGFDAVRTRKIWSDNDIRLLKLVGEIFANALDRTSAETQLQTSVREKEVLLREIHHRVKNNMQIVDSLLYLQAQAIRGHADAVALDAFTKSQSRIKSMAAIHDRLYRSRDLSGIDCSDYLNDLVPELLNFYETGARITTRIESDSLRLAIDQAIPCGLIVNELLTNCLKHGFPDGRNGTIRISLKAHPDGRQELSVVDDGVGLPAGKGWESPGSMGLRLVRDLVRQLEGQITLDSNGGTRVRINFTAPQA